MRNELLGKESAVETIETTQTVTTTSSEVVVLTHIGDVTAWDVTVDVPASWVSNAVTMHIYGRAGGRRARLAQLTLDRGAQTPSAGRREVVCSIRGTPVSAVEIAISTATALSEAGSIKVDLWRGSELPAIDLAPAVNRVTSTPVRLFAGNDPVGTATSPLMVRPVRRTGRAYSAVTGETAINASGITTHAILWSGVAHAFDAEVQQVTISYLGPRAGNFTLAFRIAFCDGPASGGTASSAAAWDGNDAAPNICTLVTGRTARGLKPGLWGVCADPLGASMFVWEPGSTGHALVLPRARQGGLALQSVSTNDLSGARVVVSVQWTEVPTEG